MQKSASIFQRIGINLYYYCYYAPIKALKLFVFRRAYKVIPIGLENVPQDQDIILAPNHITEIDGPVIGSVLKTPFRFAIWYQYCSYRPHRSLKGLVMYPLQVLLTGLLRSMGAIPIASYRNEDPVIRARETAVTDQAFETIYQTLDRAKAIGTTRVPKLMYFPEGALTKDGDLQEIKKGLQKLSDKKKPIIVPVYLDQSLFHSKFAVHGRKTRGKRMLWGAFKPWIWHKREILVVFGQPFERGEYTTEKWKQAYEELQQTVWDRVHPKLVNYNAKYADKAVQEIIDAGEEARKRRAKQADEVDANYNPNVDTEVDALFEQKDEESLQTENNA